MIPALIIIINICDISKRQVLLLNLVIPLVILFGLHVGLMVKNKSLAAIRETSAESTEKLLLGLLYSTISVAQICAAFLSYFVALVCQQKTRNEVFSYKLTQDSNFVTFFSLEGDWHIAKLPLNILNILV